MRDITEVTSCFLHLTSGEGRGLTFGRPLLDRQGIVQIRVKLLPALHGIRGTFDPGVFHYECRKLAAVLEIFLFADWGSNVSVFVEKLSKPRHQLLERFCLGGFPGLFGFGIRVKPIKTGLKRVPKCEPGWLQFLRAA